jgi:hypothetical protein
LRLQRRPRRPRARRSRLPRPGTLRHRQLPAWSSTPTRTPAQTARRRPGLPGRGPGPARRPLRTPLAASGPAAPGAAVPLHPPAVGLQQALARRQRPDRVGPARPGGLDPRPPTRRCGCWTPPRCRVAPPGRRSSARRWAGLASYGYCAAHRRWYWGLKLYLLTAPDGMPVNWCLATPKLGERDVAAELLADTPSWLLAGTTVIGDKGFAGAAFDRHITDLGVRDPASQVSQELRDQPPASSLVGGPPRPVRWTVATGYPPQPDQAWRCRRCPAARVCAPRRG